MKYCLKYTNKSTKIRQSEEIQIKYIEDKGLLNFLSHHPTQRINLLVDPNYFPESEVKKLAAIHKTYPQYNFAVALTRFKPKTAALLYRENIPFYEAAPCLNWEDLQTLLAANVSDINISGPLGFELPAVRRLLDKQKNKVQVRATPNKVTNANAATDPLVGFYIRPEDLSLYEEYIDVIEFEGIEHQDSFYSIYAEQQQFIGNLNQCIYDLPMPVDNKGLVQLFGQRRIDCKRECLSGGYCRRCYSLTNISKPMGEYARQKMLEKLEAEISPSSSSEQ